jgi:4a-hydroxytetrahydrobiopterin dehydratase
VTELAQKHCVPCMGGVPPLKAQALRDLANQLGNNWNVVNEQHLEKSYEFPDFKTAWAFTDRVGAIAESEGHHPDIHLTWGKVTLTIWTHKIDGLTESDFILAARADAAYRA